MLRIAVVFGSLLTLCAQPAWAGQASASFSIGWRIGASAASNVTQRFTWGAAEVTLQDAGYRNIQRTQAAGSLYWFSATSKGQNYLIAVSIIGGQITQVVAA